MRRPEPHESADYYKTYIAYVEGNDFLSQLEQVHASTMELLASIPEEKGNYAYAEGKWTIKQLLVHLLDAERVFNYRALRFARNDSTDLPGYDHNEYAQVANVASRSVAEIAIEFAVVRASTIALFSTFSEEELNRAGKGSGVSNTVLALGFIIVGHEIHHMNVLRSKYLN